MSWLRDRIRNRVFPPFRPRAEWRRMGRADGADVRIGWFGTASHSVETATTTLLLDAFVTRQTFAQLATEPLRPSLAAIDRHLPKKVDAILCGHSHYDHAADAPFIAKLTGAKLMGSASTCAWGRAIGLPEEQLVEVPEHGLTTRVGDCTVRFIPSQHGKAVLGRVPLPGVVKRTPGPYGRLFDYRMGGAFGLHVTTPTTTIYHNGSADLVDAELRGHQADVLLACLAGRKGTERYLARLVDHLAPKLIVPTHHDAFFSPLEDGVHLLPGIDVDGFLAEAKQLAPTASVLTPLYGERIALQSSRLSDENQSTVLSSSIVG